MTHALSSMSQVKTLNYMKQIFVMHCDEGLDGKGAREVRFLVKFTMAEHINNVWKL